MVAHWFKTLGKLLRPFVIFEVLYNEHDEIFFHLTEIFDHEPLDERLHLPVDHCLK